MNLPHLPGIYSDGSEAFVSEKSRRGKRMLEISFRVLKSNPIKRAWLRMTPDGEAEYESLFSREKGPFEYWTARFESRWRRINYRFEILTELGMVYFNQLGLHGYPPSDDFDFVHLDEELPVSWLPGRTFYQIFPDRFARARAQHCSGRGGKLRPWGKPPKAYGRGGHEVFFGGNLAGIEEKLDYLLDLGIGALYLNPIFHAPSNHRYDTQDFKRIDPLLGCSEDFARLVNSLHERGLRIILDAVFNHVGSAHHWFNKEEFYSQRAAYQDPQSSDYSEFFVFHHGIADHYDCWRGVKSLPKLDFRSKKLREKIYIDDDAVAKIWLKEPYNADGWRFDVANMLARNGRVQLHREVWQEMRAHLKRVKRDAYLMGEHFFDPVDLLDGSQLDGVMNYQGFYFPLLRWLTKDEPQKPRGLEAELSLDYGAEDFAAQALHGFARLPFKIAQGQFNIIGSHDTSRILSLLRGDKSLFKLAATLLMTFPGVPCIYYGDEVGLQGIGDPACRACMPWDESDWDHSLRNHFKLLIECKRELAPLAKGGLKILRAEGDLLVFARIFAEDLCLVVANSASSPIDFFLDLQSLGFWKDSFQSPLSGKGFELSNGACSLTLEAQSSDIYHPL